MVEEQQKNKRTTRSLKIHPSMTWHGWRKRMRALIHPFQKKVLLSFLLFFSVVGITGADDVHEGNPIRD